MDLLLPTMLALGTVAGWLVRKLIMSVRSAERRRAADEELARLRDLHTPRCVGCGAVSTPNVEVVALNDVIRESDLPRPKAKPGWRPKMVCAACLETAGERGACGLCRHANHGTLDALDGILA